MVKEFLKKFDTQRFIIVGKIIFILLACVIIYNLVDKTNSRYESNATISAEASVAFFVVDQGTYEGSISLDGLEPSTSPFYYTFYVRNYNDSGYRTDVNLQYDIRIETTTNLPLTYEIIRNQSFNGAYNNLLSSFTTRQDANDVYYKTSNILGTYDFGFASNQVDQYTIKVNFPISYKDHPEYQGSIEIFSIIINARQVA
ncbi:MAG: hypothetical protein J6X02_00280 [Bacilli bacterium]|nr:hypothetical protein [Bacilli bacterium]